MHRLLHSVLSLTLLLAACAPVASAPVNGPVVIEPASMELVAEQAATVAPPQTDARVATTPAEAQLPALPPATCPVTPEPAPSLELGNAPHDGVPYPGHFWYGHDGLWTELPLDGTWAGLPRDAHGYGNKLFFWQRDYDAWAEPEPALTVTGRRLDAEAAPLDALPATNGYTDDLGSFMLTGANFPTAGCWEVTATYQAVTLAYVIWIAP